MDVDVQDFEADPDRFIELVETIGEITITRDGRPIARLRPAEDCGSTEVLK